MTSFIKWLFIALIVLLAIAIAIPVAATFFIEQDEVKQKITSWFQENTGRTLTIHGEVGFEPGLEIRLYAEDVSLQNPSWARRPVAFSADRVELTLALAPLFRRQVEINGLMLNGADLWVEYDKSKGSNLQLVKSRNPGANPSPVPGWFDISRVHILDSQIHIASTTSDRIDNIGLEDATLEARSKLLPLEIQADGAINGLRVNLEGSASTLESILARQPTTTDLRLTTPGGDKIDARGVIEDVLRWRGIEAKAIFSLQSIPNLSPLFDSPPLDIRKFSGTALFRQPTSVSSMALEDIDGYFQYLDLDFLIAGKIAALSRLDRFNLTVTGNQELDLGALLPLQNSTDPTKQALPAPKLDVTFGITGSASDTRLDINNLTVSLNQARLKAEGAFSVVKGGWSEPVGLTLRIENLPEAADLFGLDLPGVGEVVATANLRRQDRQFELADIRVKNISDVAAFSASGDLTNLGDKTEGRLALVAEAENGFFQQSFYTLPLLPGKATASGVLVIDGRSTAVEVESLAAAFPGGTLTANGKIDGFTTGSAIDLDLEADVTDWLVLGEAIDKKLPAIAQGRFTAQLLGAIGGGFDLMQIQGGDEGADRINMLSGELTNLGESMQGSIDLSLNLPQSAITSYFPESQFANTYFSGDDPVTAAGSFLRSEQGQWSLDSMVASARFFGTALSVSGRLEQFAPAKGQLAVTVEGEVDNSNFPARSFLPDLAEVNLDFEIPIAEGVSELQQLSGLIKSPIGEVLVLSESVGLESGLTGDIDLRVILPDLKRAFPAVKSFRENLPLDGEIALTLSPGKVSSNVKLNSRQNDFNGSVNFDYSASRPGLEIDGRSRLLDVDTLLTPPPREQRFFSELAFLPDWMQRYDGFIKLKAERFSNNALDLDNLDASVSYDNFDVAVRMSAQRGKGSIVANIDLPANADNRIFTVAKDLPITAFRSLMRREIFQGGTIDASVNLTGEGNNLADTLAAGNGVINLDINDSSIKGSALDNVGGDLFYNLLTVFNPFIENDKLVNVECGVIHLDLADGKAVTRNGLAMKTDRVTLLGGGEVSMQDEEIRVEIAPKPRKGFGISASSFAKMIRIGGSLSEPEIEASASGFFKSGAAIGAAIFSGGLSLIGQGLLDRLTAGGDVCALARGEVEKKTPVFNDVIGR